MKNEIPFETKAHSMSGKGSLDFNSKEDLIVGEIEYHSDGN